MIFLLLFLFPLTAFSFSNDFVNVIEVQPGEFVRHLDGWVQLVNEKRGQIRNITPVPKESQIEFNPNWQAFTIWINTLSSPISFLKTTWNVPTWPKKQSGQLLYYFNGLIGPNRSSILQPVLQWGYSPAGGGSYWAVASWYVLKNGTAFHSKLIPVESGHTLIGTMRLTGGGGAKTNYSSLFEGISGTELTVKDIPELPMATEAFEAYGLSSCSNYAGNVDFREIEMRLVNGTAPLLWTPYKNKVECGQYAEVLSQSTSSGRVMIHTE